MTQVRRPGHGAAGRHIPRLHVTRPIADASAIELPPDKVHHLCNVLRLQAGDPLIVFDGAGGEFQACIACIDKHSAWVAIERHIDCQRESVLQLTLAQGIARGDRMDFAIGKAVELGACKIQPLFTQHSQIKLSGARLQKKAAHWQRIAISAAEQSGRERLPSLGNPVTLHEFLDTKPQGTCLVLSPDAHTGLADVTPASAATLLVGPESGLSEQEVAAAVHAGYTPVRMGPRILRTETAAIAGLAAVQALWGDLACPQWFD